MMTNHEPDAAAPLKQDQGHDNGLRHEQDEPTREEVTSTVSSQASPTHESSPARRNEDRRSEISCDQAARRDERRGLNS